MQFLGGQCLGLGKQGVPGVEDLLGESWLRA